MATTFEDLAPAGIGLSDVMLTHEERAPGEPETDSGFDKLIAQSVSALGRSYVQLSPSRLHPAAVSPTATDTQVRPVWSSARP